MLSQEWKNSLRISKVYQLMEEILKSPQGRNNKRRRSSRASSDDEYFGESPSRYSPASMIPPSLPPFGRWWISFSRPFLSIRLLLPIHHRDHSIYLLLRTWLQRFPRRSDSLVVLRMGRLDTPFCILSTSLKGSRIRPLRGRNCRRIPTFWTYFGTRSPIVAMCPCRLKIPLP